MGMKAARAWMGMFVALTFCTSYDIARFRFINHLCDRKINYYNDNYFYYKKDIYTCQCHSWNVMIDSFSLIQRHKRSGFLSQLATPLNVVNV